MKNPRRFKIVTNNRISAHGVTWDDGSCSVRWYLDKSHMSFVFWPSIETALRQSFTGTGESVGEVVWIDPSED